MPHITSSYYTGTQQQRVVDKPQVVPNEPSSPFALHYVLLLLADSQPLIQTGWAQASTRYLEIHNKTKTKSSNSRMTQAKKKKKLAHSTESMTPGAVLHKLSPIYTCYRWRSTAVSTHHIPSETGCGTGISAYIAGTREARAMPLRSRRSHRQIDH